MGKGTIISGGSGGEYAVRLNFDRTRTDAEISRLTISIADITAYIATLEEGQIKETAKLRKLSMEKRKLYLQNLAIPVDEDITAWCADFTENLSGAIGTVEVPGERGTVLIRPGYGGNAAYNAARDGQLQPILAGTPAATFYNLAMLAGWQKWMPTYRYGVITGIDYDNNLCSVTLENIRSSVQNLSINQSPTLTSVPIEYMECNAEAFETGDHVLIQFTGQSWSNSKVIGFKANPKECPSEPIPEFADFFIRVNGLTPTKAKTVKIVDAEGTEATITTGSPTTLTRYPTASYAHPSAADGEFTSPSNVFADDGSYATRTGTTKNIWYGNLFGDFDLGSLGAGDTINSVTVRVQWKNSANDSSGPVLEACAYYGGSPVGSATVDTSGQTTDEVVIQIPSGLSLAQLQTTGANGFCIGVRFQRTDNTAHTASVDYVRAEINYTSYDHVFVPEGLVYPFKIYLYCQDSFVLFLYFSPCAYDDPEVTRYSTVNTVGCSDSLLNYLECKFVTGGLDGASNYKQIKWTLGELSVSGGSVFINFTAKLLREYRTLKYLGGNSCTSEPLITYRTDWIAGIGVLGNYPRYSYPGGCQYTDILEDCSNDEGGGTAVFGQHGDRLQDDDGLTADYVTITSDGDGQNPFFINRNIVAESIVGPDGIKCWLLEDWAPVGLVWEIEAGTVMSNWITWEIEMVDCPVDRI